MNILYVAFPCNPYVGSESKIGWNIPLESSKYNDVIVVTIKDMKKDIDDYIQKNGSVNINFYYVDLPKKVKKALKKLSTVKLTLYHKLIYKLIKNRILKERKVDIIHQITPVEVRAIGNYGKLNNIKFVVGPLGGAEEVPKALRDYIKGHSIIENIRKTVNKFYKFKYSILQKYKNIDYIMFANSETCDFFKINKKYSLKKEVYVETGLALDELKSDEMQHKNNERCNILVAGRLIYRKGHELLIDALKLIPSELNYEVSIIGDGPNKNKLQEKVNEDYLLKDKVHILGKVDFAKMNEKYNKADILIMPSIRETTGSVIMEAMSQKIPVIAMNRFGASMLINEKCGWIYDGKTKEEMIENLAEAIKKAILNPNIVLEKGENAREKVKEHLFENKVRHYNEIYKKLLNN